MSRMNLARLLGGIGLAVLALPAAPASAHHSVSQYDLNARKVVTGTVKSWQWTNPHAWLWVTVPQGGKSIDYGIEFASLTMLRRSGMTKDSFKAGQKLEVTYSPLKNGDPGGAFQSAMVNGVKIGGRP